MARGGRVTLKRRPQKLPVWFKALLVTVALAMMFLGEKLTAPKVAGVLCIVVGVGLITGFGRTG